MIGLTRTSADHSSARARSSVDEHRPSSPSPQVRVLPGAPFDSPAAAFGEPQARSSAGHDRSIVLSERSESKGNLRSRLRDELRLAGLVLIRRLCQ